MIRPAIAIVLLLSAILMMRGVAKDWHRTTLVKPTSAKQAAPEAAALPPAKDLVAPVPASLPDLRTGYLFNQERMLASPKSSAGGEDKGGAADFEVKPGLGVSLDQISYAGSLIAKGFTRAVVVYPAAKQTHAAPPHPVMGRPPSRPPESGDEHAQLGVGDQVEGYTLTEIEPSKLIFTKGEETVEKPLYDATKKRLPPPPKPPAAGPPRPPGLVGGLPGQMGPGIHPVIGAPAASDAPASSSPSVSMGGAPALPSLPSSPSPAFSAPAPASSSSSGSGISVSSPAPVSSPAAGAIGGPAPGQTGGQAPMTLPIRRMIIPRQPAPDTSRVNRGGEGDNQAVPMAPTAIPGNNPTPGQ